MDKTFDLTVKNVFHLFLTFYTSVQTFTISLSYTACWWTNMQVSIYTVKLWHVLRAHFFFFFFCSASHTTGVTFISCGNIVTAVLLCVTHFYVSATNLSDIMEYN